MKTLFTALFVFGALYFSSCTKLGTPVTNVPPVPKTDTVTNLGYMNITFGGKTYNMPHMVVTKSPVHTLIALTKSFDQQDTLWISQIQVTDHKSKIFSIDLTSYNISSGAAVGTYDIRDNSSTFTDFTEGKNRVYAVSQGGTINITSSGYTTKGNFNINLHYNSQDYPASGTFEINGQ